MKKQDNFWRRRGLSQRANVALVAGRKKRRPVDRQDGEGAKTGANVGRTRADVNQALAAVIGMTAGVPEEVLCALTREGSFRKQSGFRFGVATKVK